MISSFFGNSGGNRPPRGPSDPTRFDAVHQVHAYWEGLRHEGALPARALLDPRGIEGALTCAFLAEQVAPGIARFRIAGTQISDLVGMDVRGMPISCLFAPDARLSLMQVAGQVFSGPARLEMDLEAERAIGRPALEARLLMLPMLDDQGRCTLSLGCLALSGEIGRAPRRFAIARRQVSPVLARQVLATIRPAPQPAHGFGESQVGFTPPRTPQTPPRAQPGKPYLRLVKNDG
tara:strand:- start:5175 stop:5876 length:702 start_codon:yes stop_codon:yes gene_type:complete